MLGSLKCEALGLLLLLLLDARDSVKDLLIILVNHRTDSTRLTLRERMLRLCLNHNWIGRIHRELQLLHLLRRLRWTLRHERLLVPVLAMHRLAISKLRLDTCLSRLRLLL